MTDPPLDNPYAPPLASLQRPDIALGTPSDDPPPADLEAVRLAGLGSERLVRALGPASFASGFMVVAGTAFNAWRTRELVEPSVWDQIPYIDKVAWIARAFVVPSSMVVLHVALGFGFRKLEPWARRWQIGLSSSVLAAFAINRVLTPRFLTDIAAARILAFGVVHVVMLYFLSGTKGAMAFSEEYHRAIEATPQVGRRLGPAAMTAAILGGLFAGWGDDSVADVIARHFATRLMGAHPEP